MTTESQTFKNSRKTRYGPNSFEFRDALGEALTERVYGDGSYSGAYGTYEYIALNEQHNAIRGYATQLKKELQINRKYNPFKGDVNTNLMINGLSGGAAIAVAASNADKRLKIAFSAGVLLGNLGRNFLSHEGRKYNLGNSEKIFWK